jgi:hypothetical protein
MRMNTMRSITISRRNQRMRRRMKISERNGGKENEGHLKHLRQVRRRSTRERGVTVRTCKSKMRILKTERLRVFP